MMSSTTDKIHQKERATPMRSIIKSHNYTTSFKARKFFPKLFPKVRTTLPQVKQGNEHIYTPISINKSTNTTG